MKPLLYKSGLCLAAGCCCGFLASCAVISRVVNRGPTVIHALPDQDQMASPLAKDAQPLSDDISFSGGRYGVSEAQRARLLKSAEDWKKDPKHLVIAGFSSSDVLPDHARALSQRRAEAVRSVLIQAGLDASMLHPTGYGNDIPSLKAGDVVRIYAGK